MKFQFLLLANGNSLYQFTHIVKKIIILAIFQINQKQNYKSKLITSIEILTQNKKKPYMRRQNQIYNLKIRALILFKPIKPTHLLNTIFIFLTSNKPSNPPQQSECVTQKFNQLPVTIKKMSSLFNRIASSFSSNSSKKLFNQILSSRYDMQAKFQPLQLRRILKQPQIRQLLIKELSTPQSIPNNLSSPQIREAHQSTIMLKNLKKISLFHHVVLYYNQFAEMIQEVRMERLIEKSDNCWFITNIIKPYICFLQKYCLGIEMFNKLRLMPAGSKQIIFQCMCYAINMFKSLFSVVNKLPAIGRYFRDKNPKTIDYFVQLMAYHAQVIYQGLRACISQIISFSKEHLSKKQDEAIFKQILSVDLMWVNQQMKKLFLDKYFYPYGKGYGVKLYRIEDQNQYQTQVINGILNDHQNTQRLKQARMLQETLFPTHGASKFNHQDLEKSFSFSLSKLEYLRKEKKDIQDPEKQYSGQKANKTMNQLHLRQQFRKKIDFTAVKATYVEEVEEFVEDV